MQPKKYNINGKTYVQKSLVLGQWEQLIPLLDKFNFAEFTAAGIIREMSSEIYQALAIVLIPEGIRIKNKDIAALADEFAEEMPLEILMEILEDFFLFNRISSLASKFKNLTDLIIASIRELMTKTAAPGSTNLSESCAPETSPGATGSPGTSR